jgi:DNA topoisomerase IB
MTSELRRISNHPLELISDVVNARLKKGSFHGMRGPHFHPSTGLLSRHLSPTRNNCGKKKQKNVDKRLRVL